MSSVQNKHFFFSSSGEPGGVPGSLALKQKSWRGAWEWPRGQGRKQETDDMFSIRGGRIIKMKKHPVFWFYVLAFAISWLGWLPTVVGSHGVPPFDSPVFQVLLILPAIGPALAALVVTRVCDPSTRVSSLLRPLLPQKADIRWAIIAILMPFLLLLVGRVVAQGFGWEATLQPQGDTASMALSVFMVSLFTNPWEEIGWRGFALPRLQKQTNAVFATLIVGLLWGLWHLPLFFWQDNPMSRYPFLVWLPGIVAVSFIYTWLYNSTKGSLFAVMLFHIFGNVSPVIVSGVPIPALTLVYCVAAVFLIAFGRKELLERK